MNKVVIVDAGRTPVGKTNGSLAEQNEVQLMSTIFRTMKGRWDIVQSSLDDVLVGCCFPSEPDNLAKKASIFSGIDKKTPAATINRTCASSLEALSSATMRIQLGYQKQVLVGGVENMSKSPHVMKQLMREVRKAIRYGMPLTSDKSYMQNIEDNIGVAVEWMAIEAGITREEQDEYARKSRKLASEAWEKKYFDKEIMKVTDEEGNIILDYDESIESDLSLEDYQNEKPLLFADGNITKYNAASITDGAAGLLLMSEEQTKVMGYKPMAEIAGFHVAGRHPKDIGTIPAIALDELLLQKKMNLSDIGLIECNEAYAAQMLLCERYLEWDTSKVNINGGGLAIGHPLGSTGVRIVTTLLYNMIRTGTEYGIATMCAGGGMGYSVLLKNMW